jgi:hypothetical protein
VSELTNMIGGKPQNAESLSKALGGYASAKEDLWRVWEANAASQHVAVEIKEHARYAGREGLGRLAGDLRPV